MNDQQILSVIKDYIQNRSINQALMITGEWGCGKSYFVKNSVKEYLRKNGILDNKNYIVFSLYGINNLVDFKSSFYDTIFMNQYLGESDITRKTQKFFERLFNSCSSTIDTSVVGVPLQVNLTELIHKSDLVQLKNCILVFDDIERCGLSATELWGFINKLTENRGIPVITVANESKILEKDLETDKYKIEKEKAIYCTIEFSYEIANIFDELVNKYNENSLREYILSNKEIILEEIQRQQPNNIRTLKFVLAVLVNLLRALYKLENKSFLEHSELYDKFLKYILLRAVQYKVNPKIEIDWKNDDFGFISKLDGHDTFENIIWGFKFIDIYINSAYLDNQLLIKAYENQLKLYEEAFLAFNHLADWTKYCDEQVCEWLNQLKDEVKNYKYNNSMLKQILWRVASIKHYTTLQYDFESFVEEIKIALCGDNRITRDILLQENKADCIYKTYKELINPLVKIADENYRKRLEKLNLFKCLSSNHMSNIELLKYIHVNINEYYNAKEFAKYLGTIDELKGYFMSASECDIDSFRGIIRTVYLQIVNIGQFLEADKNYLEEILKIVKSKIDNEQYGAIMEFNLNCLAHDLKSAIQILSSSSNNVI